jgi:hypothetical protein
MKKLLFHFDTDPLPSTFDAVVAYDGGADHLIQTAGVTPHNAGPLVEGTIYTRPPKEKQNTAIFIGGSNLEEGQELLAAVRKNFFNNFRVSVMLDSSGCNTTASAGVALLKQLGPISGKRAVVLAGTGPVGQRVAVLLAKEGAEVLLTSRRRNRAEAAAAMMSQRFDVRLHPTLVFDDETARAALQDAHIIFATGTSGVQLLSAHLWQEHPTLELIADVNTQPPLGVEDIDMMDKGIERNGKLVLGGIGIGAFKLKLHRACIGRLFESNNQILDVEEIYAQALTML